MPGKGPAPKVDRRRSAAPERGEWRSAPGVGWQHGPIPSTPGSGMTAAAKEAWSVWMRSWIAAHWTPDDLPGLRMVLRLYNAVERGDLTRSTELRQMMDNYGITPKGQQDRRWTRPKPEGKPETQAAARGKPDPYAHLRDVSREG